MECRAEINRFAVFLFCLLVPFGSMAPTKRSESKMTTGERQSLFTKEIPTFTLVIQQKADKLFKFYNNCISATFQPEPQMVLSGELADRIPQCAAFQTNCCALHDIYGSLQALEGPIKSLCPKSSEDELEANLNQLNTTLSQGIDFYTCRGQDLPQLQAQVQALNLAKRKNSIWSVLVKYKDIMQLTANLTLEQQVDRPGWKNNLNTLQS